MTTVTADELVSVDPATLEPIGSVPRTPPGLVPEIVAEARLAQERWARSSWDDRRALLRSVSRVLLRRLDELAALVTAEVGKPLPESYVHEVFPSLDTLAWLDDEAEGTLAPESLRIGFPLLPHKHPRIVHEPYGVVVVISPWNFPLGIPLPQIATAVVAGNAVVLKPSELTPLTGAFVEELFREAGSPPGLVRTVQGEGELGAALVSARGVGKVIFTGSVPVGRKVAAAAAERLTPVTLELGGKHPMLVLADADVDRAVAGATWGAFVNCGQACVGIERIYVARELHDAFLEGLVGRVRALRVGRGDAPGVEVGPVVSEGQRERVEQALADTGGEILTGGGRPELGLPGWFHEPTVVRVEEPDDPLVTSDVFGPVVAVTPVRSDEEALRLANASPLALGASVWSRDTGHARRVAARLDAGMVWTNDFAYTFALAVAPWGGRKDSGYGTTRSRHGLLEVTQRKFVDDDAGRVPVPWWFPYGPHAADGFRALLHATYGRGLVPRAAAAARGWRGLLGLGRRYLERP